MKSAVKLSTVAVGLAALLVSGCGKADTPSRDHIDSLRQQVYKLQVAVAEKNRVAVDSLLSVEILDYDQDSDSLLSFVYGKDAGFSFTQFGEAEIVYTDDKARVDCFVMDSTSSHERPVTFTLVLDDDNWLFKKFEAGLPRLYDSSVVADTL
ncbi:MAG: hypothetical protein P1R58_11425 [bacterium]|nr:hypothetical protein [bacterium]